MRSSLGEVSCVTAISSGHEPSSRVSPILYEVSEVISTYTYRVGLGSGQYDMSTAVNLYSSAVNLVLILTANWISKKVTDSGIF